MTNDKLKLFKSEEELVSYAKINGYDTGSTDELLKRWKDLENTIKDVNTVKNTIILTSDMEYK